MKAGRAKSGGRRGDGTVRRANRADGYQEKREAATGAQGCAVPVAVPVRPPSNVKKL
jgi:hypothetical protein